MLARYQHVVALLWFHLLNHIRRIVATYIFPIIIIGLGALLLLLYSQNKTNVKDTLDDGVYDSDFSIAYNRGDVCPGFSVKLENFSEKNVNGTLQVGITDRYGDFSVELAKCFFFPCVVISIKMSNAFYVTLHSPHFKIQINFGSRPFKTRGFFLIECRKSPDKTLIRISNYFFS